MTPRARLVLASQSPARLATLRRAGVEPEVVVSGVDEDDVDAADAATLVLELARRKATAVATRLGAAGSASPVGATLVLGCDSLLEFGGAALGKPGSAEAAVRRWRDLRGHAGVLHTGHVLVELPTRRSVSRGVATGVRFADVTDEEIETYCATGEPATVAGAFTIDGLGGWFVESVSGDHHNVVGLSLPALREMLRDLGHSLADIGYPTPRA